MDQDFGGQLWFVVDVVFVALLALAMVYALLRWRAPRPSDDTRTDAATRQLYRQEDEEREERSKSANLRS